MEDKIETHRVELNELQRILESFIDTTDDSQKDRLLAFYNQFSFKLIEFKDAIQDQENYDVFIKSYKDTLIKIQIKLDI